MSMVGHFKNSQDKIIKRVSWLTWNPDCTDSSLMSLH